jgi:hypothetical protein
MAERGDGSRRVSFLLIRRLQRRGHECDAHRGVAAFIQLAMTAIVVAARERS